MENKLAALNKLNDEEKAELFFEIRILKEEAKDQLNFRDNFEKQLFFYKWLFISKVKSIQISSSPAEEAEHIHRQLFQREMNRLERVNGGAIDKMKEEFNETKSEVNELCQKLSQLECAKYVS